MKLWKGFLISLQFLTIIPIKKELPMDQVHIERSVQAFPLLGLFQGILYSFLLYALIEWTPFSTLATAAILCLFTFFITGGMHLDGWMDMSDAYFSYQDHQRKLEIMADSNTGAFGVISVIVLMSTRFLFIYESINLMEDFAMYLILLIPFLSKTVLGYILIYTKAAKSDGMAFYLKEACTKSTFVIFPVYVVVVLFILGLIDPTSILMMLAFVIVAMAMAIFVRQKAVKWFGGMNGDVLGATVEGTENILWMTLWLLLYFVTV